MGLLCALGALALLESDSRAAGWPTTVLLLATLSLGAALYYGFRARRDFRDSLRTIRRQIDAAHQKIAGETRAGGAPHDPMNDIAAALRELETGIDNVIEQRQAREREVMRADQLAMVGQVAAGFAHEIRNPLTAVKMLVQTARKDAQGLLPREDLNVIEHEIRRMERSLQRFLDFARPPRPERRALDLRSVIDRVYALLQTRAARQKVELIRLSPVTAVIVDADDDQIQQLVMNLVLNALDAMPSGGKLELMIEAMPESTVELRVSDTGPGIQADLLPRLFDPFISTKETGIGLGLAVSFRIAERHGGSLSASNRPEGGACFVLRLPAGDAASSDNLHGRKSP